VNAPPAQVSHGIRSELHKPCHALVFQQPDGVGESHRLAAWSTTVIAVSKVRELTVTVDTTGFFGDL